MTCTLQGTGAVLSFTASGLAVGPYPGTFTESGSYTLGPPLTIGGTVGESIIGFSATFSIQSPAGTVTGTKTGTAAQQPPGEFAFCTAFGNPQFSNEAAAFGSYTATITTAQGSFRDTGGQTLAQVNQPPFGGANGFFETFVSSNGVVPLSRLLMVTVHGRGSVMSAPAGISCPTTCGATFRDGEVVTLKARAQRGSVFARWTGACTGHRRCSVRMSGDKRVGARFRHR